MKNTKTQKLTIIAMLSTLAFISVLMFRLPISVLPFLKYDPKDIIIVIAGFIYTPMTAVVISVIVSTLEMVTISDTLFIGFIMNILSTCAFTVPASIIYHRRKSMKSAILGLGVGIVAMVIVMTAWNYFLTPLYAKIPREEVITMLAPIIVPFNLIKGGLNAAITMLVYKQASSALRSANLIPKSSEKSSSVTKETNWIVLISSGIIVVSLIFIILVMKGIL